MAKVCEPLELEVNLKGKLDTFFIKKNLSGVSLIIITCLWKCIMTLTKSISGDLKKSY